uniref:Uncharacterized protein n=1 Tax=Tanacetum cinerariifolium TaxID=118510 RepID=A0A699I7K8_TANCI|nr:hypothetical protein [Tanacetum cinerariifolium]
MTKTINGEAQIHARVDGKEIIITESFVRRDLRLAYEKEHVVDKAVYKELDDRLVRAATIASSLEVEQPVTKTTQALEITSLKRRVKKLKKKQRSRTHKLKRLYKVGLIARVDYSKDDQSLGKDASKQGRKIYDTDVDEDITLVNDQDDAEMFDVNDLHGEEVFVEKKLADKEVNDEVQKVVEDINTAKLIVDAAQVSATGEANAASIATTVSAAATITTDEITLAQALVKIKTSKPKAKGIILQEPSKSTTTTTTKTIYSKNSQDKGKAIMIEEPVKLKKKDQIRLDEEAALKLQAEWDDIQAKIDADYQMAERLQAEEQQELTDAKKTTLFMQLLEKRRNSKRAGEELTQDSSKKQKVDDDKETTELKELMEIIPDKEEVVIDVIPLAVKSLKIVDKKIHKEGKKSYYQIIRADGKSKMYMVFNRMLKKFDRKYLKGLYNLVKAKYGSTRPVKDLDMLLWGDLKTMFEPHVEDQVWKKQHGYRVLEQKLYDSCGVHSLRMQSVHIYMLVKKKYPLTAPTLTDMLNKKF